MTVILHAAPCGQRAALQLRPWTERDIPDLIDIYRDPDMRRHAKAPIVTADDAQRWLEVQQKGWRDGDRLSFAVLEWAAAGINLLLGNVVLKEAGPPAFPGDGHLHRRYSPR